MDGAWSKLLPPLKLTPSGRPELVSGEVECYFIDNVDLETEDTAPLKSGVAIFTTHRILWLDQSNRMGGFLPLSVITQIFPPKKSLKAIFATPRIKIQIRLTNEGIPSPQGSRITYISLVLRNQSGVDSTYSRFHEIIHMRAWENTVAPKQEGSQQNVLITGVVQDPLVIQASAGPSRLRPAMAGVSGILRKEQEQWEETDKNLQDAFVDLNALMSKAKEMVILAEKMRAKLIAGPNTQSAATDEEEFGSKQEMQDWMLSVGIASPVTKETAGALYHQQLSRQLADFVKLPLEKNGGMIALVDVYCLFNRARGTELISPEDLLRACTIWSKIDVPVILRKFDSGVMVVQSKSQSDEEVFFRIRGILARGDSTRTGISASEAATSLGMPPALAKEQLLAAESKGDLCRDDGPDGLRFYLNFFKEIDFERFKNSL